MEFGYTLMSEEHGPLELLEIAERAEAAGFAFLVQSDHFHPWVPEQKHSPNAWTVLGGVAARTSTIELQTFVTCPIIRYHPAIVAQQAATLACMSNGRFTLGVGAGERLNEHVVGMGWPPVDLRHEMLDEALIVIRQLWSGGYQSFHGKHFDLEDARLFDLPAQPTKIDVAVSGEESLELAIKHGDGLIATSPVPELIEKFRASHGDSSHATTQLPVLYGPNVDDALQVAHRQFRWSALGWKVQAELPNPINFDAASKYVRRQDLAATIPHGPDVDTYVEAVRDMSDAGFDRLAFVQIGEDQNAFFDFWHRELRDALGTL